MDTQEFEYEFYTEIPEVSDALKDEVERKLRKLAEGHHDIIGAAVAVEPEAEGTGQTVYRARVVVYMRPEDAVAVDKDTSYEQALRRVIDAVTRQVRTRREKLGKPWERPDLKE